ncbi:MAG TPA: hypothetical protein VLL56_04980 [Terriglobia bacterium]|nr:hypothetical protein [Terriglobia bacterium]
MSFPRKVDSVAAPRLLEPAFLNPRADALGYVMTLASRAIQPRSGVSI